VGAGRKRLRERDPGLVPAAWGRWSSRISVGGGSRVRWTVTSTRKLAAEPGRQGHRGGRGHGWPRCSPPRGCACGAPRAGPRAGRHRRLRRAVSVRQRPGQGVHRGRAAGDRRGHQEEEECSASSAAAGPQWHRAGQPVGVRATRPRRRAPSRLCPTAPTTWPPTPGGCRWAAMGTPPGFAVATPGPLVERCGQAPLPGGDPAAGHRRRGWRERLPGAGLEAGTGRLRPRQRATGDGVSGSAGHLEAEQDRAPAVLPDQQQPARGAR
jgi:hypothetical protein